MQHLLVRIVAVLLAADSFACAAMSYESRLSQTQASYRSALAAGAPAIPWAKFHLRLAHYEMDVAEVLNANWEDESAEAMLERAQNDAEISMRFAQAARGQLLAEEDWH